MSVLYKHTYTQGLYVHRSIHARMYAHKHAKITSMITRSQMHRRTHTHRTHTYTHIYYHIHVMYIPHTRTCIFKWLRMRKLRRMISLCAGIPSTGRLRLSTCATCRNRPVAQPLALVCGGFNMSINLQTHEDNYIYITLSMTMILLLLI